MIDSAIAVSPAPMRFITISHENIINYEQKISDSLKAHHCSSFFISLTFNLALTDSKMPQIKLWNFLNYQHTGQLLGATEICAKQIDNPEQQMQFILEKYYNWLQSRLMQQKELTDYNLLLLANNEPLTSNPWDILDFYTETYVDTRLFTSQAYTDWLLPRLMTFNDDYLMKINPKLLLNDFNYTINSILALNNLQCLLDNRLILSLFSYLVWNQLKVNQTNLNPSSYILLTKISQHLNQLRPYSDFIAVPQIKYPIYRETVARMLQECSLSKERQ